MGPGKNALYLLTETRRTPVTRALFSLGQEVGVQQWDVYLEILAESFSFSELVLLLCDLQCKDSLTLGAGSGAPAAPFNAGHLSKHPPCGSSPSEELGSISQFLCIESILYPWISGCKTSVKRFHLLFRRSNRQQGNPCKWLCMTALCDDFFFSSSLLFSNGTQEKCWPPLAPAWCCCCLWQTCSEYQLFPHRCDSAPRLAAATRARVKKVGVLQKHATLPTWDHKNILVLGKK